MNVNIMTKVIFAFRNIANAHKMISVIDP